MHGRQKTFAGRRAERDAGGLGARRGGQPRRHRGRAGVPRLERNTINTYLTRLCDKGYLSARREGRSNSYTPLVSQEKYREFDSRSVLQRLYGGSLGSFVAALTAEKPLAQSEIDELRRYLDEMSGKAGE